MDCEIKKSLKNFSRVSDICLRGNILDNNLQLEVVTEFYAKEVTEKFHLSAQSPGKIVRKEFLGERIVSTRNESKFYPLRPITPKELYKIRLQGTPGIVYKKGNMLFFSKIPATVSLNRKSDSLGKHLCGRNCTQVCRGCPRTNDLTTAYQERIGKKFEKAVDASWRIEKYSFITEGLETFNMKGSNDAFVVIRCTNFHATHTMSEVRKPTVQQKLALASFYWDDFDGDRSAMLKRIHENEKKYFGSEYATSN